MAFKTKKKYQIENIQLQNRIEELEQLLCPAEQHDFVKISTRYTYNGHYTVTHNRYKCKRCLKVKVETIN